MALPFGKKQPKDDPLQRLLAREQNRQAESFFSDGASAAPGSNATVSASAPDASAPAGGSASTAKAGHASGPAEPTRGLLARLGLHRAESATASAEKARGQSGGSAADWFRSNSSQPAKPAHTVKRLSALQKKRLRKRRNLLIAAALVCAAVLAVTTGFFSSSLAALSDVADSIALYCDRSATWPANTGIPDPLRVNALADGFVELGREDVAVYSAYGTKVRAFQPAYARPALAVGGTRFCVYNRAGSELRVESRTKNLYTKNFPDGILLCAMSQNGSVIVATRSSRYAAQVEVYDALFQSSFTWCPTQEDGTPVALSFAADNHRFAAGCLSAKNGRLSTTVFLMDTDTEKVVSSYAADAGSMVLELDWITPSRVLAVFDTYTAILNPSTGAEAARFDYGGATLQSVSVSGRSTALLLGSSAGSTLIVLNDSLTPLCQQNVGTASALCCTASQIYLIGDFCVEAYAFDGTQQWSQPFDAQPFAVLNTRTPLVFFGTQAAVLSAPAATA